MSGIKEFKNAIQDAMAHARMINAYLDKKSPWKIIKEDRQAAADSLYVALYAISCLKTAFYPFLPFSSSKLYSFLGFDGSIEDEGWKIKTVPPGQKLQSPEPLFSKLDDKIIEEETSRLGSAY